MLAEVAPQGSIVDYALQYAAHGYFIFPTHDVTSGRCSCGKDCSSPGKHPRTPHGISEASRDPAVIGAWWAKWPRANIAVNCGKSNLVVIDVDVKKGAQGAASIRWFVERYPAFAQTLCAGSPSGGLHYYFFGSTKTTHSQMAAGLDVQSNGAYVLLPPSVALGPVGPASYHWINHSAIQPYPIQEQAGYDFNAQTPSEHSGDERVAIPYGEHRTALVRIAWTLRRVLGLDISTGTKILEAFISSGALEGYDAKHPFTKSDLAGMLRPLAPVVATGPINAAAITDALDSVDEIFARTIPERQVVIPGLVIGGELHVFYGTDGTKKTTIAAYLLALISRQGHDVCVFISEDGPGDFAQKFIYAGGDRTRLFSFSSEKFKRDFLLPKYKVELEQLIQSRQWGCIYFDSINDYKDMGSHLNAADQARQLFGPLGQMATAYNTSIICTLHTNAKGTLEGSKQISAKARVVARVENVKEIEPDEDGYDFNKMDAGLASTVTADKFSRGAGSASYTFNCEIFPAFNPITGEPEYILDETGAKEQKMLLACVDHERVEAAAKRARNVTGVVGRPRNTPMDELRERVAVLLAQTPNLSGNKIFEQVGGRRIDVMTLVRELRPR